MERILLAFVVGVIVSGIASFTSYIKFKKLLDSCATEQGAQGSFEYKGKYYDKNTYIQRRAAFFKETKPKDLQKLVANAEKTLSKGKNPEFDAVELEARKYALLLSAKR